MAANFSPSVNILRDAGKDITYIPTPNTTRIFQQIVSDYKIGIRSFNIIGSYGTGKSAFLLALEKNLQGQRRDFNAVNGHFGSVQGFEFWNIVGEYQSIINSIARSPELARHQATPETVWEAIHAYYEEIQQKNACLVIVIDEFGKFLEYAAAHTPEQELYFIQQLAEFANDESKNVLFLSTLHQGFDSYAVGLERTQRQEWEKVKGRLKELTFNEPVELLLHLAAEYLETTRETDPDTTHLEKLITSINHAKIFPHRTPLTTEFAHKLSPFDPLCGAVLTLALQRYGQNERSLFTFLQSNDRFGLKDYDIQQNPYYNLACLYDYLLHNYYSYLSTKYNPHYAHWSSIRRALDRIEGKFEVGFGDAAKLVKTVGLLNIFTSEQASIDKDFLLTYAKFSLGISNPTAIIKALEDSKIIRYRVFKQRFILFEGTDLDFEYALLDAATKIHAIEDIVAPLKKYFDFPYILAKSISYQQGTPRFFNFKLSEQPIETAPQEEIDGTANLLFSESSDIEAVQEISSQQNQAILYGIYRNTKQIKNMLFDLAKTEYVIKEHSDDRVAVEELTVLRDHQQEELNQHVLHHLYTKSDDVVWIFRGKTLPIASLAEFNATLSAICREIYIDTPIFRNELVNRHKLSGAISTARKNYIKALTEHWHEEDLGFSKRKFPAEKTIYLTLLKETGIHRWTEDGFILGEPQAPSFRPLWNACQAFLENAKPARKNLQEFFVTLAEPPLKLKCGFIDFWIPTFLFIKREEFAIYQDDAYIPEINHEILEQLIKKPGKFHVKTFNVDGVKLDLFHRYRALLQQSEDGQFTNASFIETVKPFLTFYRSLPQYTKQTQKNLDQDSIRLREVIATASDPEKTFFEDFPRAISYGTKLNFHAIDDELLKAYIHQLQTSIRALRTCFSELIDRIEMHLLLEIGHPELKFPAYREVIKERFASLREYLLPPHLKGFYSRILSEFGDRDAWISSVVYAVLHKPLEEMRDEEEDLVYGRLNETIQELDNLCDIAKLVIDPEQEKVVKLEVTSPVEGSQGRLVRLSKKKVDEAQNIEKNIDKELAKSKDSSVRIAILVKLLQRELHDE